MSVIGYTGVDYIVDVAVANSCGDERDMEVIAELRELLKQARYSAGNTNFTYDVMQVLNKHYNFEDDENNQLYRKVAAFAGR